MKENKFYIYSHTDKNGIVRYIGKGYRQYRPFSRAHYFRKRSDEWNAVFSEVKPIVSILQQDLSEEEVNRAEHYWINYYKLIKDGGTLINIVNNLSFLTSKEKLQYRKDNDPTWYERNYKRNKAWTETNREYCKAEAREYWSKPENHLRKLENMKRSYRRNIIKRKEENRKKYYELRDTPGFKEKMSKKGKTWALNNPVKVKERHKAYYETKKVDLDWIAKRKTNNYLWKEKNKEKFNQTERDWYKKNKERIKVQRRESYKLKNEIKKEKIVAERKVWYYKNREKLNARGREYYRNNKESFNAKRREKYRLNKENQLKDNEIFVKEIMKIKSNESFICNRVPKCVA